mmetsp:Transcript_35070/g.56147  ORF Transcript_35070/g.56147 Transcript_35070/m.56147 type:complete len:213 (-) Transcript_35070:168-806(-)
MRHVRRSCAKQRHCEARSVATRCQSSRTTGGRSHTNCRPLIPSSRPREEIWHCSVRSPQGSFGTPCSADSKSARCCRCWRPSPATRRPGRNPRTPKNLCAHAGWPRSFPWTPSRALPFGPGRRWRHKGRSRRSARHSLHCYVQIEFEHISHHPRAKSLLCHRGRRSTLIFGLSRSPRYSRPSHQRWPSFDASPTSGLPARTAMKKLPLWRAQ